MLIDAIISEVLLYNSETKQYPQTEFRRWNAEAIIKLGPLMIDVDLDYNIVGVSDDYKYVEYDIQDPEMFPKLKSTFFYA